MKLMIEWNTSSSMTHGRDLQLLQLTNDMFGDKWVLKWSIEFNVIVNPNHFIVTSTLT